MSKITLGNGKVLDGVRWSGDTCFSEAEVSAETFSGGLLGVKIEGSEEEFADRAGFLGVHERMTVSPVWKWGRYYAFCLIDAEPVSEMEQLRADVDYVAMMGGVVL